MSASNPEGAEWIARLGLERHPEGGWYRRIYQSAHTLNTTHGERCCASSIHYLLDRGSPIGRLHRNRSDILHVLQSGGPLEYLSYDESRPPRRTTLGFHAPDAISLLIPGGIWKGSRLLGEASHALVTELVIPGFDWQDHRYADHHWWQQQAQAFQGMLAPFIADD